MLFVLLSVAAVVALHRRHHTPACCAPPRQTGCSNLSQIVGASERPAFATLALTSDLVSVWWVFLVVLLCRTLDNVVKRVNMRRTLEASRPAFATLALTSDLVSVWVNMRRTLEASRGRGGPGPGAGLR
ncbi:hypothetical protein C8F01DRAFT_1188066 [Mycena amicta]|nr:hypothetical protein C8F01DRAFT_1188066 [Mycena amicta]